MGNEEEVDVEQQDDKGDEHAEIFQVAEEQEEEDEAGEGIIFDKDVHV